jgi:hypothetical protein
MSRAFDWVSRRFTQGQRRPPEKRGGRYKGKGAGRSPRFQRSRKEDDGACYAERMI